MTQKEFELIKTLIDTLFDKMKELKGDMAEVSDKIKEVGNKVDSLGKVVQTEEGNGTM